MKNGRTVTNRRCSAVFCAHLWDLVSSRRPRVDSFRPASVPKPASCRFALPVRSRRDSVSSPGYATKKMAARLKRTTIFYGPTMVTWSPVADLVSTPSDPPPSLNRPPAGLRSLCGRAGTPFQVLAMQPKKTGQHLRRCPAFLGPPGLALRSLTSCLGSPGRLAHWRSTSCLASAPFGARSLVSSPGYATKKMAARLKRTTIFYGPTRT